MTENGHDEKTSGQDSTSSDSGNAVRTNQSNATPPPTDNWLVSLLVRITSAFIEPITQVIGQGGIPDGQRIYALIVILMFLMLIVVAFAPQTDNPNVRVFLYVLGGFILLVFILSVIEAVFERTGTKARHRSELRINVFELDASTNTPKPVRGAEVIITGRRGTILITSKVGQAVYRYPGDFNGNQQIDIRVTKGNLYGHVSGYRLIGTQDPLEIVLKKNKLMDAV